jgi:hypothetical protein
MQRTRFGSAYNPYLVQQLEEAGDRVEIFTPMRGLHTGDAPQDIEAGYSPSAYNFVIDAGHLTPRSGLSQFKGGVSHLSGPALGAWRMSDLVGNQFLFAASSRSFSVFDPVVDSWSSLSYQQPSGFTVDNMPSGTSRQYWDATYAYEPAQDRNFAVFVNNVDLPKIAHVTASVTTYSDLTGITSQASRAAAVAAFDNRVIFFNVSSNANSYPQRVLWSARGSPQNYQIIDGAGFEDLMDMRGKGTRIIAEREGVLLFSDEEIWRGRRRNDAYVFDFYPISKQMGAPFPRTIVATPLGVIFLNREFELHAVIGDEVVPLGPASAGESSRIRTFLQAEISESARMWAVYNPAPTRYELYYTGADSSEGYPTRALYFQLTENSFLPQRLKHEVSAGVEYTDPGDPAYWNGSGAGWDDVATSWDEQLQAGTGYFVHTMSSAGTAHRFHSSQTNDDGSAFTAQWTSHALNRENQMRFERLSEVWVECKSDSAGSLQVVLSGDQAFSQIDTRDLNVPAREYARLHAPGDVYGVSPAFRVQITDGSRPKIARFQAQLIEAGIYPGEA